jgi:hypothetical protein
LLAAALGGVSAVAVAARHLITARPHATIGWAFSTAALAYAGQSFAASFHGSPVQVPTRAWWVLMAYGVLGAWVSRLFTAVVSAAVGDAPVPDVIPAQWLRRPALVGAAVALLTDACRRYIEVANHTHGRVGHTAAYLVKQSSSTAQWASDLSNALHPFALGLPAAAVSVTAAFVATVFLFGSPDLARLNPRLLTATRAAVVVLAVLAAAGSATALVLVTGAGGLVVWIPLCAAAVGLVVAADHASA